MSECPPDHKHQETSNCYDFHKCRCTPCRTENSRRVRTRRRLIAYGRWEGSRVPSTGSQRRIQGLQFLGFTFDQIGAAAELNRNTVWRVLTEATVEPKTHKRIEAAFRQLMRNPTGGESSRTRIYARKRGYLSPFAWDDIDNDPNPADKLAYDPTLIDEVRVMHAVDGRPGARLTGAERREAVKILHARKWTDRKIGTQLGCDERTVYRIRNELGLPAFAYTEQVKQEAA